MRDRSTKAQLLKEIRALQSSVDEWRECAVARGDKINNLENRAAANERSREGAEDRAKGLEKQRDELFAKCKAFNESLKYALTHSFHSDGLQGLERTFEIQELEQHVQSAVHRIFNDEQEQKRLQDLLNGTAIAVGILGQKLSRG